jgi:hypothetical protein
MINNSNMGDGRTDLFRSMWTRTTTNEVKGASLGEQAKHTDWGNEAKRAQEQQYLDLEYMPDQKMHRNISFVKSGMRLIACGLGMLGYIPAAFVLLLMAEVVGIYEELV